MSPRTVTHRYGDPLDRVWIGAAERIGLRVRRTHDAYASSTGDGELLLAEASHLDPDDSLAQMILHELCHWLVQGADAAKTRDWGLDNETPRDVPREEACLRLQAALAGSYGLRRFLAPTTDFRAFYDALPADPLAPRREESVTLAIHGLRRAGAAPFAPHLADALAATRDIVTAAAAFLPTRANGALDLLAVIDAAPTPHPSGLPPAPFLDAANRCGNCAWRHGKRGLCRQAGDVRVEAEWPACSRWEAELDCLECGACCRAAYDCVQVSPRDPVRKRHPELVVLRGPYLEVRREGDRCAALAGGRAEGDQLVPYHCTIYDDRPRSCRDFARGGEHCLTARRRVGLSP